MQTKQELHTFGHTALSALLVALVLTGIGGTIYNLIAPDGWIAHAFGRSFSAGAAALGSLIMIVGLAWFSRGRGSGRARQRYADLAVYIFAAAGALYLVQLWLKGSF